MSSLDNTDNDMLQTVYTITKGEPMYTVTIATGNGTTATLTLAASSYEEAKRRARKMLGLQ